MTLEPVLIAGKWQQARAPRGRFQGVEPATGKVLDAHYPVSGWEDLKLAVRNGHEAAATLRPLPVERISQFLEIYADNLESRADELAATAHLETALPEATRLRSVELPRTTNQLRQAAEAVRDRSWRQATLDSQNNIRSFYVPLGGPVVIFGPNNFPFAFNAVAGGDFAAAIAAGNPVIAKAHPGHPATSQLLAEAAFEAVQQSGLPPATVQLFYHCEPEDGLKLVSHPLTGATAFTGSRKAGLQLKAAADAAGKPIYLEMSSINPVVILPGTLEERMEAVVDEFATSCTLGAGQFCTNPGLVLLLENEQSHTFLQRVKEKFEATLSGPLLTEQGPEQIEGAIQTLQEHGAELVTGGRRGAHPGYRFENTLLRVSGETFLARPDALQTEAFGAVSLFVLAADVGQMEAVIAALDGNLTGTIYSHREGQDDLIYERIEPLLAEKVGRLLNDKMPTGVAVSSAMVHGGPYPATGHPGFTAVGIPAALHRFAALRSYDNVRQHRLPPELRDENPTGGMWRYIDREWTQRSL